MPKKENRCWPGYEPVKGKEPQSQGSCRPKAESKLKPSEEEFRGKRKEQLADWHKEHPKSKTQAAQHLKKPSSTKKKTVSAKTKSKKVK